MKLHRLTLHAIGPFRGTATLDLDALPLGIVALTGANGAGKSTALEGVSAALYRTLPTRGVLSTLALGRDSYVELAASTPRGRLTVRQTIDALSGKGESLVLDESGAPVLSSTSVRAYDAWAATALPAPEVYLSSLFAAQGSGGFLDLPTAERKRVVLRALGVARLEAMAARARELAAARRVEATSAWARIEAERGRANVDDALRVVEHARGAREARQSALDVARRALDDARAGHAALVAAHADAVAARQAAAAAAQRVEKARTAVRAVSDRQEAARSVVAAGAATTAAVAALPDLEATEARARDAVAAAETEAREAEDALRGLRTVIESANRECASLTGERVRLADALRGAAETRARASRRAEAAAAEDAALVASMAAEEVLDVARAAGTDTAAERIGRLRGGLRGIQARPEEATTLATTTLLDDDRAARAAAEGPARIADAITAARTAAAAFLAAKDEHRLCDVAAAALPALDRDEARLREVEGMAQSASLRATTATESLRGWERTAGRVGVVARNARTALDEARSAVVAARRTAARATEIAAAAARLEELAPARAAADAELAAAIEAARLAPEPPASMPLPPDLTALESTAIAAETACRMAGEDVVRAEAAVDACRAAAAQVEALLAELRIVEQGVADLTRLADDLGQRGLVALEVDAAGPELSELASSLLRECFGSRWTVSIQTTRPRASGDGEVEVFEIGVLDTATGTDGPVERLSGGERVIVGEAVALALTTLATRRGGLVGSTLIRDESGAALDPERAPLYVAMLRRAAALVGAERVLLVSHNPETWPLCDARVRVADGQFHVEP